MTYKPTPKGLQADIYTLLRVLAVALRNLDRLRPRPSDEETTAGHCYDDDPKVR
jgi:hypothetical protein